MGDACDDCPQVPDPSQPDADGDGLGDSCPPAAEPSALDRDPTAPPLRVKRLGNRLLISWQDTGAAAYELARGRIATLAQGRYDHQAVSCGLAAPSTDVRNDAGSWYFLAGARDAAGARSSWGRDSHGRACPAPAPGCP